MGAPFTRIRPLPGFRSPQVRRRMVLLPHPLTPTTQWKDPGSTEKLRLSMMSKPSSG